MSENNRVALYGDIHNHCAISYGHGELEAALANAALRLDFVSITGHADWPDMDRDTPEIAHIVDFHVRGFAKLREGWRRYLDTIAAFEKERGVIAFPGYEIHSNEHGDYTIVGRERELDLESGKTPADLRALYAAGGGTGSTPAHLIFPHHIGYRRGARGVNWESFAEALSPVVEIVSMHGMAESDESDKPFLHSMGPLQSYGTMRTGLERGHRFGVIGNTDHHSGHPGSYGHGLTGVWSDSRDRNDLWDALYARRTWAMSGDAVALRFTVGDAWMGEEQIRGGSAFPVTIDVDATSPVDYVETVTPDGRCDLWWDDSPGDVATTNPEGIFSLEMGWGERGKVARWDGTIEVEGAEIIEVIPRFRGPEVVSPLDADGTAIPDHCSDWERNGDRRLRFSTVTWGNMTNSTPSTQGIALRLNRIADAVVTVTLNGRRETFRGSDLLAGSVSGNLGLIDSPAYRCSAASEASYSRKIRTELTGSDGPAWIYPRVRLKNGHWAVGTPVFFA